MHFLFKFIFLLIKSFYSNFINLTNYMRRFDKLHEKYYTSSNFLSSFFFFSFAYVNDDTTRYYTRYYKILDGTTIVQDYNKICNTAYDTFVIQCMKNLEKFQRSIELYFSFCTKCLWRWMF